MTQTDNFHRLAPYLTVHDGAAAIEFYERAFGAECDNRLPSDDGRVMHASLKLNGGYVLLSDDIMDGGGGTRAPANTGATTITVHLEFDDAQGPWDRAVAAGAEPIMPLEDMFWGARYGKLRDPFGHVWSISGPPQDTAPQ